VPPEQNLKKKKKKSGRQKQDMSRIHVENFMLLTLKTITSLCC